MQAIIVGTSVTLKWEAPSDTGCLPILHYKIAKDGSDLSADISADLASYTDTSATGALGTAYVYTIRAVNEAGDSEKTEQLTVTIGQVPNAPSSL